jgi:hypothetical protein
MHAVLEPDNRSGRTHLHKLAYRCKAFIGAETLPITCAVVNPVIQSSQATNFGGTILLPPRIANSHTVSSSASCAGSAKRLHADRYMSPVVEAVVAALAQDGRLQRGLYSPHCSTAERHHRRDHVHELARPASKLLDTCFCRVCCIIWRRLPSFRQHRLISSRSTRAVSARNQRKKTGPHQIDRRYVMLTGIRIHEGMSVPQNPVFSALLYSVNVAKKTTCLRKIRQRIHSRTQSKQPPSFPTEASLIVPAILFSPCPTVQSTVTFAGWEKINHVRRQELNGQ